MRRGVCVMALVIAAVVALSGAALDAQAARAQRVIVKPRAGQKVNAYPLKIVVRAGNRLFALRARLNGDRISGAFGRAHHGKRTARISSSHALTRGRNVLRVTVRRRNGRLVRRTVRFRVAHDRPLVGAGRDRQIVEDVRFRLRGRAVRSRRNRHRIHYRWKLVDAPRRSDLDRTRRRGRSHGWTSSRARPSFVPDEIGSYTFKLRARQGSRSESDKVTLDAVPATPLVPVKTMPGEAQSGKPAAVRIGERSYAPDAVAHAWLQVIVLDRSTLEPISNKTYACGSPPNCGSDLVADLAGLGAEKLVVAVSHAGFTHPYNVPEALARIGFPKLAAAQFAAAPAGSVSAIGVPGMGRGDADISFVPAGKPGAGEMVGYLTPDVYDEYGWLPGERPLFDTRAAGDGPNHNRIVVAGKSYEGDTNSGFAFEPIGALNVQLFDGHTLAYKGGDAFMTNWIPSTHSTDGEILRLTEFLTQDVRPGDVVVISSLNSDAPPLDPSHAFDPAAYRAAADKLIGVVASLGGTRDTFIRAATTPHGRYSLVGSGGAREGAGEETSALTSPDGGGRLRGALVHDRRSLFKPLSASERTQPSETLSQLILRPATSWPLDDDPGAQNAIRWIGSRPSLRKLGPDPRSAYWIQRLDPATWEELAGTVADLDYPGDDSGFSRGDFDRAREELHRELLWVADVRAYTAKLSQPFSENALPSWIKLNAIAEQVTKALEPPDRSAEISAIELWENVLSLATVGGSEAVEAMAETFEVAAGFLTQEPDGSDADEVRGNARELAGELVARLKENEAAFDKIGDIIVSDYAKLREVGTNALCNPSGQSCPPEWAFTAHAQAQASVATYRSVEAEFDQALMRLAFPAYTLPPSTFTQAERYMCPGGLSSTSGYFHPFLGAGLGQAALRRDSSANLQLMALGANLGGGAYDTRTPQLPPRAVVERMFGPVSSSLRPGEGGLGLYAPDYLRTANPRPFPTSFGGVGCFFK